MHPVSGDKTQSQKEKLCLVEDKIKEVEDRLTTLVDRAQKINVGINKKVDSCQTRDKNSLKSQQKSKYINIETSGYNKNSGSNKESPLIKQKVCENGKSGMNRQEQKNQLKNILSLGYVEESCFTESSSTNSKQQQNNQLNRPIERNVTCDRHCYAKKNSSGLNNECAKEKIKVNEICNSGRNSEQQKFQNRTDAEYTGIKDCRCSENNEECCVEIIIPTNDVCDDSDTIPVEVKGCSCMIDSLSNPLVLFCIEDALKMAKKSCKHVSANTPKCLTANKVEKGMRNVVSPMPSSDDKNTVEEVMMVQCPASSNEASGTWTIKSQQSGNECNDEVAIKSNLASAGISLVCKKSDKMTCTNSLQDWTKRIAKELLCPPGNKESYEVECKERDKGILKPTEVRSVEVQTMEQCIQACKESFNQACDEGYEAPYAVSFTVACEKALRDGTKGAADKLLCPPGNKESYEVECKEHDKEILKTGEVKCVEVQTKEQCIQVCKESYNQSCVEAYALPCDSITIAREKALQVGTKGAANELLCPSANKESYEVGSKEQNKGILKTSEVRCVEVQTKERCIQACKESCNEACDEAYKEAYALSCAVACEKALQYGTNGAANDLLCPPVNKESYEVECKERDKGILKSSKGRCVEVQTEEQCIQACEECFNQAHDKYCEEACAQLCTEQQCMCQFTDMEDSKDVSCEVEQQVDNCDVTSDSDDSQLSIHITFTREKTITVEGANDSSLRDLLPEEFNLNEKRSANFKKKRRSRKPRSNK